ncbi:unnamed protein product [Withania somnifera]
MSLLSPKGVNYEVAALMSMKNKMRDEYHVLGGWDINSVDPCTWYMVGCSSEGFVISLEMASMGLSGILSPSIGNLTHLQTMLFQNNQLSGQVPAEIGQLSELQTLDLSGNLFDREIHRALGRLIHLNYLRLSRNRLSGQIPKPVAHLSGNSFLCSALTTQICGGVPKPVNVQQDCDFATGHLKRFSFRELQIATGNFSPKNKLGQVAVKRLRDPSFTGEVQFQTEVEMIGLAVHRNFLRLYGFCLTPEERLLIYPYMPNGSVADCLRDNGRDKPFLDWSKHMHIALGAARGLLYLHEQCNPKIIHRDVKAAKILLDESFEAVVGDFGLAKLLDRRDSHVTTAVRGTIGHKAPEYLSTGQSSEKTDVFGYRILLLELITGHKALDAGVGQGQKGTILDRDLLQVRNSFAEKKVEMLADRDLRGCFNSEELEKTVEVALQCTQSNPNNRPKMSEVLRILEGVTEQMGHVDESQGGSNICETRAFSLSRNFNYIHEQSSFTFEPIELSGPR